MPQSLALSLMWKRIRGAESLIQLISGIGGSVSAFFNRFSRHILCCSLRNQPFAAIRIPTDDQVLHSKQAFQARHPNIADGIALYMG